MMIDRDFFYFFKLFKQSFIRNVRTSKYGVDCQAPFLPFIMLYARCVRLKGMSYYLYFFSKSALLASPHSIIMSRIGSSERPSAVIVYSERGGNSG